MAEALTSAQWLKSILRALLRKQRWVWALPVVAALLADRLAIDRLATLAAVLVAVWVIAAAARAPGTALLLLLVLVPFQLVVLSALYRYGLPSAVVRPLGFWKESLLAGVAIAAVRAFVVNERRLDALDKLTIGYLVAVTAYLLFPKVVSPLAPGDLQTRLVSYRADIAFAVALLGARHAPIPPRFAARLLKALLITAFVVAAVGVYEFLFSSAWNNFAVNVIQVPRYKADVLHVFLENPFDVLTRGTVGGREFVRVGSVLFGPGVAFYLLIGVGFAGYLIMRGRSRPSVYLAAGTLVAAILFTLTRSAVASLLVLLFALLGSRRRGVGTGRVRFGLIVAAAVILSMPVVVQSALSARTSGAFTGQDVSTADHARGFQDGLAALTHHPLGLGLGTAPSGGRFGLASTITSENAYIQVGNELGIATMALFIAILAVALARLRRLQEAAEPVSGMAVALFATGVALALGGFFLHIWDFEISVTFWAAVGVALGLADRQPGRKNEARPLPRRRLLYLFS